MVTTTTRVAQVARVARVAGDQATKREDEGVGGVRARRTKSCRGEEGPKARGGEGLTRRTSENGKKSVKKWHSIRILGSEVVLVGVEDWYRR